MPEPASEPIDAGPLDARGGHSVVWAGTEAIVWGGQGDDLGDRLFSNGAAFDPATGTWRILAASPLSGTSYHSAVWTGSEMLIVGGVGGSEGAAYRPETDSWHRISDPPIRVSRPYGNGIASAWTGSSWLVWDVGRDEIASFDPGSNRWDLLPSTGIEADSGALRWNGETVYAFGATISDYPRSNHLDVARFDATRWEQLPHTDFSTDDYVVAAIPQLTAWTGNSFMAWSNAGSDAKTMALDPSTSRWSQVSDIPIAPCEGQGEPISAPGRVFAFGGCDDTVVIFDPTAGTWTQALVGGNPTARYTVWTGDQLINWGDMRYLGNRDSSAHAWSYTPDG